MKYLIASDIHGSKLNAQKIVDIFHEEKADKLILLGDIFNHGPRNPLPEEYSPMEVAKIFNDMVKDLIVIKGNCDSEVDTMISDFDFLESTCIVVDNKTIFLTHGHVYNKDKMPKTKFNAVIYGHFHTGFIDRVGDVLVANPGSTSLPKNNTKKSYILLDGKTLYLKDLDKNIIDKMEI